MARVAFNVFVIILGFCLLAVPIIVVKTTYPPGPDQFNIQIEFNYEDEESFTALNRTLRVFSNTSIYWKDLQDLPEIVYLNNLSKMIEEQVAFNTTENMSKYGGYSKKVHLFSVSASIITLTNQTDIANYYAELFGDNGTTFLSLRKLLSYDSFSIFDSATTYPNEMDKVSEFLDSLSLRKYLVTINFSANIIIDGVQSALSFSRLILVGEPILPSTAYFFLTNENVWQNV